jgi:T-complex protein 1 subunit beta
MSSFVGAIAIADMVKTTLGPKGMDKILQSVSTTVFYLRKYFHSYLILIFIDGGSR